MKIPTGFGHIIKCDLCGDTCRSVRNGGYENCSVGDIDICSGCCVSPTLEEDEKEKARILMKISREIEVSKENAPPFWPRTSSGKIMSIAQVFALTET